ncbi:MAG: HetZ-related protein 2 [Cyanobacteria bacterium J06638_6]
MSTALTRELVIAELVLLYTSRSASIVNWLLGESPDRFDTLAASDLAIAQRAIEYRYRILQQRYWDVSPEEGYQRLIKRLSSLFLIRSKIKTWISLSRDRRRSVVDVIQEVIQEMMRSDRHLAQQLKWIATCTHNPRLRNLLMLASIEEYCLRPIRNQPLIIYRFVNYLRRSQKGGMTQVPTGELIRLVSDEISAGDSEDSLSLLDVEAWNQYQETQTELEQQSLRHQVKDSFANYLSRNLDDTAARWLELHLKGLSQEQIAQTLDMPVQQVYRLREKISYHAIRIFALREQPAMVLGWLKTSLQEHNFGLTPTQWEQFWPGLSPEEQAILTAYKDGQPTEELARRLGLKNRQIQAQWVQLYLKAQELRTQSEG